MIVSLTGQGINVRHACRMLGGSLAIAVLNLAQGQLAVQAALLAAIPILGALTLARLAPPTLAGEHESSTTEAVISK